MQVLPGVLSSFRPQLVLYDAGVDIHVDDELGRLSVSDQGEGGLLCGRQSAALTVSIMVL
jgi:acetoin utilization deacetylase AcuC-like enzyme